MTTAFLHNISHYKTQQKQNVTVIPITKHLCFCSKRELRPHSSVSDGTWNGSRSALPYQTPFWKAKTWQLCLNTLARSAFFYTTSEAQPGSADKRSHFTLSGVFSGASVRRGLTLTPFWSLSSEAVLLVPPPPCAHSLGVADKLSLQPIERWLRPLRWESQGFWTLGQWTMPKAVALVFHREDPACLAGNNK